MTVVINGTSGYIADFSNATVASRQAFQTSTSNGTTGIYALPNGTSTAASWQATNAADPTNASKILIATNGSTDVQLVSGRNGTGTYLPLSFYTNGSQQMVLNTSGYLGIGNTNPTFALDIATTNAGSIAWQRTGVSAKRFGFTSDNSSTYLRNETDNTTIVTFNNGGSIYVNGAIQAATSANTYVAFDNNSGSPRIDFYNGSSVNILGYIQSDGLIFNGSAGAERGRFATNGTFQKAGDSNSARILPSTDNVGYVGESAARWQAIYAVNGTIQTSDGREKNTIVDSNLGLDFVQSLRPVSYKWNVGENIVTYDEDGKEVVTPRAGVRTHYGFIAQEVKAAIPEGVDFGGFVEEPNDGPMSLRYHEFIGPLVKAIQEQQAIIQQLQADVEALKGQA